MTNDPLERRGLVEIAASPEDKRTRSLTLTLQGHALLATAVPIWKATHAEVDHLLAEHVADDLRQALGVLE